jgi:hypothetical protein
LVSGETVPANKLSVDRPLGSREVATSQNGAVGRVEHLFFFFSNRLGCLPSLLLSLVLTLVLLALTGVIR